MPSTFPERKSDWNSPTAPTQSIYQFRSSDFNGLIDHVTGWVNVKSYGAVGNGVADDTAAIQAAIDAAQGRDVLLPSGDYLISSIRNLATWGLRLRGAGREKTTLRTTAAANVAISLDRTASSNNHHLSDFSLVGTSSNTGGILLGNNVTYRSAFSRLSRLAISGFTATGAYGISLDTVQEFEADGVRIFGNTINVYRPNQGYLSAATFKGFDGYIGTATTYGVKLDGDVIDLTFRGTVIESNAKAGIYSSGPQVSLVVDGCYFEDNGHSTPNNYGTIRISGGSGTNRSRVVIQNSHFFAAAANNTDPTLYLDQVFASYVGGNHGLFREGGIVTTANTECHFGNNAQPIAMLDTGRPWAAYDMLTIYQGLSGKATYDQTGLDGNRYLSGIESGVNGSAIIQRVGTSTSAQFLRLKNTSGEVYLGIEGSGAGGFFTGSDAYATALYSPVKQIQLIVAGTPMTFGAGFVEGGEISDPAAPASNKGRLYFKDNGSGKTQLVVRFPTGAVQVVATEP